MIKNLKADREHQLDAFNAQLYKSEDTIQKLSIENHQLKMDLFEANRASSHPQELRKVKKQLDDKILELEKYKVLFDQFQNDVNQIKANVDDGEEGPSQPKRLCKETQEQLQFEVIISKIKPDPDAVKNGGFG